MLESPGHGGALAGKRKTFECCVVNETVSIRLRNRRVGGFGGEELAFVQCDQADCQYVDKNEPPCPLSLQLFSDEIDERKERARMRQDSGY